MYVACTRAKEFLELYVPATMYDKGGGRMPSVPSPFVRELSPALYDEWQEGYTGGLAKKEVRAPRQSFSKQASFEGPASPAAYTAEAAMLSDRKAMCREQDNTRDHPPDHGEEESVFSHPRTTAIIPPSRCGYCRHRIFGRGKIVQHLPPDKYRVNFPGFGLKVIMAEYLSLEDD